MKQLLHIFNVSKNPMLLAASALTTEIMPITRLNYNPNLIPLKSVCPLPKITGSFNKNFADVSLQRATDLWIKTEENGNVNILWSGGIDSTAALISLIITRPESFGLTVYCNLNSIIENVPFYTSLLKNKNVTLKNSSSISIESSKNIITGDLGDQIFGSELLFKISQQFGYEKLFSPYQQIIPLLFAKRCGEVFGKYFYERYCPIVQESPIEIITVFDFVWWWNFTQKWQGVKYRKQCFVHEALKLIHFFDSDDFQLWSIFYHNQKIGKTIETYKLPAKELIFSFDKNDFYLNYKKKLASPFGGKVHYFGLYDDGSKINTWGECCALLDSYNLSVCNPINNTC